MKLTEKKKLIMINVVCIVALAAIVWPLLVLSKYNYPSADDWSYGVQTYQVVRNHEGIIAFVKAVADTVQNNNWEARFANVLLATLQPGIFGEHSYVIVAYLMIGSIIFSEICLLAQCFGKENSGLIIPVCVPMMIIQLLYTPSQEESFYWYTGAVNYTFIFSLSVVLTALTLRLAIGSLTKAGRVIYSVLAGILAILIGGDNFASSLSTFCLLFCLLVAFLIWNKPAFKRTWFVLLVETLSMLKCMTSPLTKTRIDANFGGGTANTPLMAIWLSFERTFLNVISWTDIKIILLILFILPFVWKAIRKMNYSFRFPGVFTLLSFGVYSSQATATLYVDGTMGGGRQAAILWYAYVLWIIANVIYWCGWIPQKAIKAEKAEKTDDILQKYLLRYCIVAGGILSVVVLLVNVQQTSSYRAYRMWKNGWAQAYGQGWEERLKVLKDDSVQDVVFTPLYPVELIMYTDLQPEDGYTWVNSACAEYYGKKSIIVVN